MEYARHSIAAAAILLGAFGAGVVGASPIAEASAVVGVVKEAPSPAQLSREEQEALDNKNAGRPYDQAAYNRAMQKIKQAEKYNGDRNKQKRNR
ncbi:hypothetical protein [Nocardia asiatica]|uniref:hypothetical protein n=1 Tax=Nocardia asiatica TaxID=209252 RepID=UPI000305D2CD|nr:hypothetical protein [Nocardia asiatica]